MKRVRVFLLIVFAAKISFAADLLLGEAWDITSWARQPAESLAPVNTQILSPAKLFSCAHVRHRVAEHQELMNTMIETKSTLSATDWDQYTRWIDSERSLYKHQLANSYMRFYTDIFEVAVELPALGTDSILVNTPFSLDVVPTSHPLQKLRIEKTNGKTLGWLKLNYLDVCLDSKVELITIRCWDLRQPACREGRAFRIETQPFQEIWTKNFYAGGMP